MSAALQSRWFGGWVFARALLREAPLVLLDRPDCYWTLSLLLARGGGTDAAGSVGTVAKFAGSSPVRLSRNATMSRVSASPTVTPSCIRAMTRTASGSVATDPS